MFDRLRTIWNQFPKLLDRRQYFSINLLYITLISLMVILGIEVTVSTLQWAFTKCSIECSKKIECPKKPEPQENSGPEPEEKLMCCNGYFWHVFKEVVRYTTKTSVILMVIVFFYLTFLVHHQEKNISRLLTEVLIGSLSISAIPTGISLAICAFYDIEFIKYMSGVEIYIAFAGISIIIIGFLSTSQELHEIEKSGEVRIQKPEDAPQILAEDAQQLTNFPQLTDE